MTDTTTGGVSIAMVTLDCPDPRIEARFWSELLDWEIAAVEDEYAMLKGPDSLLLGFGQVPDYQPPGWPNHGSKQFHFDVKVSDIPAAERRCVELGASVPDDQPGDTWRVLLDPAGHPFCLTDAANWA
ncbi:MAG: VOC family protein [Microlunatus sp.]|nr:VOC family protein [Microlunatus sp.]MDN5770796.1 VOC family protein [Microlunatus sp.]MDN5805041.1 VOC family protein [Microlunatus sp.]